MLNDIPYNELKKNKRAYEIMLLRDQCGKSFSAIANAYGIVTSRASVIYHKIKVKQMRLYMRHIAYTLGHDNMAQVAEAFHAALECYWDIEYACAYMEDRYRDILTEYRNGEPGISDAFVKKLPPFRVQFTPEETARVVHMRETERASFPVIGEKLGLTRAKAARMYELFYHEKTLKLLAEQLEKAESTEEKENLRNQCFRNNLTAKKRYEMLCAMGWADPSAAEKEP